jgi:DNA-binding response OmpR family regulator
MENEHSTPSNSRLSCGELVLDLHAKTAAIAGEPIALTPLEFNLLAYMAYHQTRPVPVSELLEAVWNCADGGTANQVTCCIKRLRKKLAGEGAPQYLHNQRGFGFRLCEPEKLPSPDGIGDEESLTLF